jgi:hypothetical protein
MTERVDRTVVQVEAVPILGNASVCGVCSKQIGTGLRFHKIHVKRNLCHSFQSSTDDIRFYLKQGLGFVAIVREALADAG